MTLKPKTYTCYQEEDKYYFIYRQDKVTESSIRLDQPMQAHLFNELLIEANYKPVEYKEN